MSEQQEQRLHRYELQLGYGEIDGHKTLGLKWRGRAVAAIDPFTESWVPLEPGWEIKDGDYEAQFIHQGKVAFIIQPFAPSDLEGGNFSIQPLVPLDLE